MNQPMSKCISWQKRGNLLYIALPVFGLFYSPLVAQNISHKKLPMELEFGVGIKTVQPLRCLLEDLTKANMSYGGFAESRLRFPGHKTVIRLRAALDDWGQNIYSKDRQYSTDVWRIMGTAGVMQNFSSFNNAIADLFWCIDVGVNHWDINSTNPLFGKEKYNRLAAGMSLGLQTEHIFIEFVAEYHSMDNKGIERAFFPVVPPDSPLPGLTTGRKEENSAGAGLSFVVGWKF